MYLFIFIFFLFAEKYHLPTKRGVMRAVFFISMKANVYSVHSLQRILTLFVHSTIFFAYILTIFPKEAASTYFSEKVSLFSICVFVLYLYTILPNVYFYLRASPTTLLYSAISSSVILSSYVLLFNTSKVKIIIFLPRVHQAIYKNWRVAHEAWRAPRRRAKKLS